MRTTEEHNNGQVISWFDESLKQERKEIDIDHRAKFNRRINGKRSELYRCPICGVYEEFITNVHCMKEHGVSKADVESKYGKIVKERLRKGSRRW